MLKDFLLISEKLKDPEKYRDFVGRVSYFLNQKGKDAWLDILAPYVIASGKITNYEGSLKAYTKSIVGSLAALIFAANGEKIISSSSPQKITDWINGRNHRLLLIFYESGCGACESLLKELPEMYKKIAAKSVRVISIASDTDKDLFSSKVQSFPWKDKFQEESGVNGIKFRNFGVVGTPTMILIDDSGKIIMKSASLKEILSKL